MVKIYASCLGTLAQKYGGLLNLPKSDLAKNDSNEQPDSELDNSKALKKFRNSSNLLVDGKCFAHYYTEMNREKEPARVTLNDIGPYAGLVSKLEWTVSGLKSLPEGIPEKLKMLEAMDLTQTSDLQQLPQNMSSMEKLQVLSLAASDLSEVPADIGDCPSLEVIAISNSKVIHFPTSITRCMTLKKLTAHSMMLKSLPEDFPRLSNLTVLDLNLNPLQKLPKGFGNLKALKTLKLSGTALVSHLTSVTTASCVSMGP